MFADIPFLSAILDWLKSAVIAFLELLPESPIQNFATNNDVQEIFGYVNWVVPIGQILIIMSAILSATIVWYAVRWVLRFARYVD